MSVVSNKRSFNVESVESAAPTFTVPADAKRTMQAAEMVNKR
jgi:hypothetical protein